MEGLLPGIRTDKDQPRYARISRPPLLNDVVSGFYKFLRVGSRSRPHRYPERQQRGRGNRPSWHREVIDRVDKQGCTAWGSDASFKTCFI